MDIHQITAVVEAARAEQVAFLQKMVQTASLPDHEHEVQDLVAEKLKSLGLEVELIPSRFDELQHHPAFGDDGFSPTERVNVVGRWRGTGSGAGHSLILNGHVDVVPVGDPNLWNDSPWSGAVRDARLYGRGACDMKAGLCAGIFAIQALQQLGYRPAREVLVESVIGEESGGIGTIDDDYQRLYGRSRSAARTHSVGNFPGAIRGADLSPDGARTLDPCRDETLWCQCHREI